LLATKKNGMALQGVGSKPQGVDELSRLSQNVLFDKDRDGQVAGIGGKVTGCQKSQM
jgi:hypothetical protein